MSRSVVSAHPHRPSDRADVASGQEVGVTLTEQRVWNVLCSAVVLILSAGLASRLVAVSLPDFPGRDSLAGLFRLDSEANLPSLFSTLLLFGAATAFGVIARAKSQLRDRFARVWWGLCWLFVYLAVDENAQLHERPAALLASVFHTSGFLTYAWVIPYGLLCAGLLVSLLRFLAHLPIRTRNATVAAGFMYLMGAMGLEMIEGQLNWIADQAVDSLPYILLVTAEEGLEMVAISVLIVTLLGYLRRMLPDLRLSVRLRAVSAPD